MICRCQLRVDYVDIASWWSQQGCAKHRQRLCEIITKLYQIICISGRQIASISTYFYCESNRPTSMTHAEEVHEARFAKCWPTIERNGQRLFVSESALCRVEIWHIRPDGDRQREPNDLYDEATRFVTRLASTTNEMENVFKVRRTLLTLQLSPSSEGDILKQCCNEQAPRPSGGSRVTQVFHWSEASFINALTGVLGSFIAQTHGVE